MSDGRLFDPGPLPFDDGLRRRAQPAECCHCGEVTRWIWSEVAQVWSCDGYSAGAKGCGLGQGSIERSATPAEVDAGCELGITWDPVGGWPDWHRRRRDVGTYALALTMGALLALAPELGQVIG